jgi:hypothetical protein
VYLANNRNISQLANAVERATSWQKASPTWHVLYILLSQGGSTDDGSLEAF